MTRHYRRHFGEPPLQAWLRAQPDFDSQIQSVVITDADFIFHKYRLCPPDQLGTRDVQLMMMIEVKCRGHVPTPSQEETLYMFHQLVRNLRRQVFTLGKTRQIALRHYGVYALSLPGLKPDDHDTCKWGRFGSNGRLGWRTATIASLRKLLAFELRPDTLRPIDFRRHHARREIVITEQMPLGFAVQRTIMQRS